MFRQPIPVCLLALLTLVPRVTMAQSTYSVKDLGILQDLAGRSDSGPSSINRSGVLAGANVTNGAYHAVIYNGTWRQLGTLGGTESFAGGINDSNWVAGYSQPSGGGTNAFLWSAAASNGVAGNPQMLDLGTLGGPVSEAFAINNAGQISGYSDVPGHPSTQQHAFRYSAGKMTDIGILLPSLPNSFGYSINASGHVAGAAFDVAYSSAHLFFFDGTNSTDLGTFGGLGATALALNNSDTIAGYLTTTSSVDRAFCIISGTFSDIGTLGGNYSYARSVNNSNIIVGGSFVDTSDSVYHAFLWNSSIEDLNTLLDSSGTGWVLNEARAINDVGQIAGVGSLNGVNHAFLLLPGPSGTNPPPPKISVALYPPSHIVLSFSSTQGVHYTIQTNSSATISGWGNTSVILSGTGSILSVTNSSLKPSPTFYRIRASTP